MPDNTAPADPPAPTLSEIGKRRLERRNSTGRKSDERWREIQQAASRVFRRLGYAQATLEDVAAEANINRATLYYYVRTKVDLLVAVLESSVQQLLREIDEISALPLSPSEKLRRIIASHVRSLDEHPEHFIYLAENVHRIISEEGESILVFGREYGERMRTVITEGIEQGEFRPDLDPRLAMLAISGMLNWIHRWYDPNGPNTLAQVGETFADIAIGGLRAPTSEPASSGASSSIQSSNVP